MIRSQALSAKEREEISLASALSCDPDEDKTRQEFKDDSDVNVLLRRHGVLPTPAPLYGECNFDIGLQEAMTTVREAQEAFTALPEGVRAAYPNLPALLNALAHGKLKVDDGGAIVESAPAGDPASVSAPVPPVS